MVRYFSVTDQYQGGLSWLSDIYGLVADNVLNFEVSFPHREPEFII